MKEIIRRALIVVWIFTALIFIIFLVSPGPNNANTWFIPCLLAVPTWAMQFIALGISNPIRIFRSERKE
jgi:hypothetical protein